MYTTSTEIRVRYAETDQMGVVYYGNYAQYFEVGRVECIRTLGMSYKAMEEEGIILPVVHFECKYLRPAKYDDLLTIETSIRNLPNNHIITFHQEVFNEAKKLLTTGKVTLYFLEQKSMKKVDMPTSLKNILAPYFK